MKNGAADFSTWLFVYSAFGSVAFPVLASIHEYRMIFVSTKLPEEMNLIIASSNGYVMVVIVSTAVFTS